MVFVTPNTQVLTGVIETAVLGHAGNAEGEVIGFVDATDQSAAITAEFAQIDLQLAATPPPNTNHCAAASRVPKGASHTKTILTERTDALHHLINI